MKLREILRYEVGHALRSPATWGYGVALFMTGLWMFVATADGEGFANAPERVAGGTVIPALFGVLVSAAVFGGAAVRDIETGMHPLVDTKPVNRSAFLVGRFLGALTVNAILAIAIPLGVLAATALMIRFQFETVGPFDPIAHIQPYFVLLLPDVVFIGAVLFAVGIMARHIVPVYLIGVGLVVGYVVVLNYAYQIDSPIVAGLVDPLGLVTVQRLTIYWTEAERNARLIGLPASLAWNRLFWLAASGAILAAIHGVFRFAHVDGVGERRKRGSPVITLPRELAPAAGVASPHPTAAIRPPQPKAFGYRTAARQTLAVARNSLAEIASSRWFIVVVLACVGFPLLWGWNVGDTVFDTSTWPVTALITEEALANRSPLLFIVLVLIFAGELVWKERDAGVAEIVDVSPVPDSAALLGRFLSLIVLVALFQAASIIGGMLIQTLQGYYDFEVGLYLRMVFGILLTRYLLIGALAVAIHVLVNHKNLGHIAVLLTLGFFAIALPQLGVRHHLLRYGTTPEWTYSEMNGFGPFAAPIIWFRAYWGAWAMLLLIGAALLWVRGVETGLRYRLQQIPARFTAPLARTTGVAIVLIVLFGGYVFYNTNILNAYRPTGEQGARQAEYELRYGGYRDAARPTIERVELRAEIYPEESAVELRGSYHLVNLTDQTIDSVHVTLNPDVEVRSLSLDPAAEAVHVDDEIGYRIFVLERPLAPGGSARLEFDVVSRRRGFANDGNRTDLVANGTRINRLLMPAVGYQPYFELTDGETRQRFGLGPREPMPGPEDAGTIDFRWQARDSDLVHVDAIIGTSASQTAVTPGVLRRSWSENGRNYFHYQTEEPIPFGGTIVSAEYAVLEDRWDDVELRIFHHPAHAANLDRILQGMKAALEYMTREFGPYPYSDLRVVEIPRYGGYGSAHPHTIAFTEDVFFSRVREGEVDQPFYGTAHEVAHAWWGGMVRGVPVRGAEFLSESLANYSAILITEATYGREAGRRVYGFHRERYLMGRAVQSREVPVLEVESQPYISYRKGAMALYVLREHIGGEAVNTALRRYFERFREGPPYPTSLDLYAELRAVTPDSLHGVLTDWFETITLWDVEARSASVEPTGTGEYVITLDVSARKVRADGSGNETEVPIDDVVQIGVFAAGEGEPLYLEWHRIQSGDQTIRVTVPRPPARAGIDPYDLLIDRNRTNNVVAVGE